MAATVLQVIFRELVRADQKRKAGERLEQLLLDGLNSSPAKPLTKADIDEVRRLFENASGIVGATTSDRQSPREGT